MLTQYMVLLETTKSLMVLRPYQIYAVQKIVEHVQNSDQNGYIWHTTGSGKTLTSFKASQIIMQMPDVEKVLFVVDRNDLDTQTSREFNAFKADSVDSTDNTSTLVKQLDQRHDKLIVTTIQKLNRAISTERYLESIDYLKNKKWSLFLMNVIAVNLVRPIRTSKNSSAMHKCLVLPVRLFLKRIAKAKQV